MLQTGLAVVRSVIEDGWDVTTGHVSCERKVVSASLPEQVDEHHTSGPDSKSGRESNYDFASVRNATNLQQPRYVLRSPMPRRS